MQITILFGKRVRWLRRKAGMTQEMLAEAAQLSPVSVSNIERGLHAPSFRRLPGLAEALKVEIHELFVFDGDKP